MPLTKINNWIERPHDHLFEELAGCTERCPFCKEQCDIATPNHYPSTKHSIAVHRPQCLGGYRYERTQEMVIDVCSADDFCNDSTKWNIADKSLDTSLYWKLLVGHYDGEIAQAFGIKRAEIPIQWKILQWINVKKSLKDKYRI